MMHEANESNVLDIIKKLMEELSEKMEYSKDDFEERLGRKKPAVEIEVTRGPEMMIGHDKMAEMDPSEDDEYEEMPDLEDEEDEGGMLKKRLMNLRKA